MRADSVYDSWQTSSFNAGWVFTLADLAGGLFPRDLLYAGSDNLMEWFMGRHPEVASAVHDNISGAFPRMPHSTVTLWTERTFLSYGRGVVDYLRTPADPPRVVPAEGAAERLSSLAGGRILVAAHMGNWEVGGAFIGKALGKHWIVGFPERSRGVEAFRRARRRESGHTTVSARGGLSTPLRLRRALEAGESVIYLVDRAIGRDAVPVLFRGRRTSFLKSPALLSNLTGVPLVPVGVMAERPGLYSAYAGEPIAPEETGGDPEAAMQRAARFFGLLLERYPDQWYNFFRYWREESRDESGNKL